MEMAAPELFSVQMSFVIRWPLIPFMIDAAAHDASPVTFLQSQPASSTEAPINHTPIFQQMQPSERPAALTIVPVDPAIPTTMRTDAQTRGSHVTATATPQPRLPPIRHCSKLRRLMALLEVTD